MAGCARLAFNVGEGFSPLCRGEGYGYPPCYSKERKKGKNKWIVNAIYVKKQHIISGHFSSLVIKYICDFFP